MSTIDDLLSSAEKIAHFGIRSGRITNTALLDAVGNARAAKAAGQLTAGSPAAEALVLAVQEGARMISPTTVAELNRGWDPFASPPVAPPPVRRSPAQWATLAATVFLVVAAGYYTLWHKRATDLMTFVVDEAVNEQHDAVLDVMLPMLQQVPDGEGEAGETSPDPLQVALFLEDVSRIQQLQRSIDHFKKRFESLHRDRIIVRGQLLDLRDWLWGPREEPAPDGAVPLGAAVAQTASAAAVEGVGTAGDPGVGPTPQPASSSGADALAARGCSPPVTETLWPASERVDVVRAAGLLSGVETLRDCLTKAMEVDLLSSEELGQVHIALFEFDHALNVVGSWLLPAIYGALGALIYFMRQFLDPLRLDPPFERVLIRVSLGAFAGITVGWFFTPTTVAQGFLLPDVGMAMLTFAFVLGFSIEVFFGFLERLVSLSNEGVARLGKPS